MKDYQTRSVKPTDNRARRQGATRVDQVNKLRRRRRAIQIAAILDIVEGLAGVVVGFLLLIIALLAPSSLNSSVMSTTVQPFLEYFSAVLTFSASESLIVGFVLMSLGVSEMIVGYYLWRRSRVCAILSVVISIIGLSLIIRYGVILALAGLFTFVHIGSVVIKLGSLGYGWPSLSAQRFRAPQPARSAPSPAPPG